MSSVLAPVLMMPPGRPLMKKMTSSRGRLLAQGNEHQQGGADQLSQTQQAVAVFDAIKETAAECRAQHAPRRANQKDGPDGAQRAAGLGGQGGQGGAGDAQAKAQADEQ
jgi:hypothetical protein